VWLTLWKRRNNSVFRPTLHHDSPEATAAKAAFSIKVHLQHLVLNDPDNQPLLRLLLLLLRNDWARANLVPLSLIQAIFL